MKVWLSQSIARKLLTAFVGIFCTTYLLTAVFVFTSVRTSMTRSEVESMSHLADQKMDRMFSVFDGLVTNLKAWSQLEVMNDLLSGDVDKRVERTLNNLKTQYVLPGEVYVFDAQGRLIAGTGVNDNTVVTLPPAWAHLGKGLHFVDKHTDPLKGGASVALSMPIAASFSPDVTIGAMVLTVPWRFVEDQLLQQGSRILLYKEEPGLPLSGLESALDPQEVAALTSRQPEVRLGGQDFVAGYSEKHPSFTDRWHVVALRDANIAFRPIWQVALELVGLGLALSIPIVLAIRWISRKLTAPVESLTQAVSMINSSGDLSVRARVATTDELGTLARAFNGMAENLQHTAQERERFVGQLEELNKTLEQRVQERTRELELANTELTGAIDNLKAAQSQLVHSEKMASLGQLVAGVAHELNNPIGFIYANFPHLEEYAADLFELIEAFRSLPLDDEHRALIERKIQEADLDFIKEDFLKIIRSGKSGASRIKEIISSLRSFSRLDEAELKSVLLEHGIDDTFAILQHHIRNRVEVVRDFQLNQPVLCRAGQINQVFMNIIYNAIQAMEGAGRLEIATRSEGEFAVVSIRDNGKGIPPDILGKIFDPFFTTKKVGEGTGLGLSISYGIVEKHGGLIEVSSEVGRGTQFTVKIRMKPEPDTLNEEQS